MITKQWTKIKRERGLYRYNSNGTYHARVRFRGKLIRRKLETSDLAVAKRKLLDFKRDLRRTDHTRGNTSFAKVLDDYAATLSGAKSTLKNKNAIIAKLKQTLFGCDTQPLHRLPPSQFAAWFARHYGDKSASAFNQAVTVCRDSCAQAVADRIITESPAAGLKYRRPAKPIRDVPTHEQFKQIVDDIRSQKFNPDAQDSADFVEFLGLAGLGQAEAASITRADVDLDSGRFVVMRKKTSVGYVLPMFPQLRPLMERLCANKKPHMKLFAINQARKAISNACQRLGFARQHPDGRLLPQFSHRSMRRYFVTTALERGIDPQTVSRWQNHHDGGKLVLSTYGFVTAIHEQRMAQLMATEQPANVISITAQA